MHNIYKYINWGENSTTIKSSFIFSLLLFSSFTGEAGFNQVYYKKSKQWILKKSLHATHNEVCRRSHRESPGK